MPSAAQNFTNLAHIPECEFRAGGHGDLKNLKEPAATPDRNVPRPCRESEHNRYGVM